MARGAVPEAVEEEEPPEAQGWALQLELEPREADWREQVGCWEQADWWAAGPHRRG